MIALDALLEAGVRIDNVAAWCRVNGVNPRTFYRHRDRVKAQGRWRPLSKRPLTSPAVTPPEVDAWICKLRVELGADNGADYIRDALIDIAERTGASWSVPARSTINRVLARHELLERNPAKRPRGSWRRFAYARPRDCYQIDATTVALADGRPVVVFEVLDDCTRLLTACRAAAAETTTAAIAAITTAVTTHGPPAIVLADNGSAFSATLHRRPGTSRFARHLAAQGIRLIHSSPYHPQTCGKVERHHQTLKKWLATQPTPRTLAELQRLLDTYRAHYNHRRHSALPARATPHHAWTTAPTHGTPNRLPLQVDATVHHRTVRANGTIAIAHTDLGIGTTHTGQRLTAIRDHDHITVYTPDGRPLGHATLTPGKRYLRLTPH